MTAKTIRRFTLIFVLSFCFLASALPAPTYKAGAPTASVAKAEAQARAEKILSQMTPEEKIDYIGGVDNFFMRPIPRLQVPILKMSDGPLGVRVWGASTEYPAGIAMAASWNIAVEKQVGEMMGMDARARGVHILLAPGMNIYRAPMCGRNFEYFGEDPFLASRMAVAVIQGVQDEGVIATAKHFIADNQEWDRHNVNVIIDERTMREIYLPAFEASVKEAKVGALMDSYSIVNGDHMTQSAHLMNDIAKKDWGFDGVIMSDWTATYDGVAAANAGLDLEMPYAKLMNHETMLAALRDGKVSQATIDDKVLRILRKMIEFGFFDRPQFDPNASLLNQQARKVALDGALGGTVLLKNNGILPINPAGLDSIAVIGPRAYPGVPEGAGSAKVDPLISVSFLEGISNRLFGSKTRLYYASGAANPSDTFSATEFTTKPGGGDPGLTGEYFNNQNLTGQPALVRTDAHVNFKWGTGSYAAGGPAAHYSVRWTGYYTPKEDGEYNFYAAGRDGFRVFVDDKPLMDEWEWESTESELQTLHLEAGKPYKIRLEYFKNNGNASFGFGVISSLNPAVEQAKDVAARAGVVILCIGLDGDTEGESRDRKFELPGDQLALIKAVQSVNTNVVVVLTAGGNVDMTGWSDSSSALLHAWYPGQEGGTAIAQLIFGDVSPSGKLPVSFEKKWEDSSSFHSYYDTNGDKQVKFSEGIFVGYRHFDKSNVKPMFPFGFGLSYTTFKYGNLKISPSSTSGDQPVTVSFDITNTGKRQGAEVAQVYVTDGHSKVDRPVKELKGFGKVDLKPGETKSITVTLNRRSFSYYDVNKKQWVADPGEFGILVGSSSQKIELTGKLSLTQ